MIARMIFSLLLLAGILLPLPAAAQPAPSRDQANAALRKAVQFFRQQISIEGGYLWQYSSDLSLREGEGKATATEAWVQSPGTPTVGLAYLNAYHRTGESYLLDAARQAATALVRGQLVSGGWDYRLEFNPQRRSRYAYRLDQAESSGRNTTTLDDDNTQSALRFLMQMDRELSFQDRELHACVEYALDHLLAAQYPNGAWPQRFTNAPDAAEFPVLPAAYPESWSRTFTKPRYNSYYTFNDNTIADMIRTMLLAARVYDEPRYQAAAEKAGGFIILAQMPDPQPAWAQQYNQQMCPAWARKFEPPAVTGGESQGVMRVLMTLYQATGNKKYLEPIPRAVKYLRRSTLPDGRLARFYELKTNKPLYFTKQYELTYLSDDMPTHYGFIVSSRLDAIQGTYDKLIAATWKPPTEKALSTSPNRSRRQTEQVRSLIAGLDARGAWVESGQLRYQEGPKDGRVIGCSSFVHNVTVLSEYMGKSQE